MTTLRLAFALLRRARVRLLVAAACLAVAVAARVLVGSLGERVDSALASEARGILGADIEVSALRSLDDQRPTVAAVLPAGTRSIENAVFTSMAAHGERARAVEVRAVAPGWPLAGTVRLRGADGSPIDPAHLQGDAPTCAVQDELLRQLDVAVGGNLRLGSSELRIVAVIADEPGLSANPFQIGPRVLMGVRHLAATGLDGTGSRIRRQWQLAVPDPGTVADVAERIRVVVGLSTDERRAEPGGPLPTTGIQVRTSRDASRAIGDAVDRFADFLRLLALCSLLLGAVGVAAVVRAVLAENREAFAVVRTLGSGSGRIVVIGLVQAAAMGAAGAVLGGLLGTAAANFAVWLLASAMGVHLGYGVDAGPVVAAGLLAVLAAVLAGLPAVWAAARETPLAAFRAAATGQDEPSPGTWWRTTLCLLLAGGVLLLVARVETRSWLVAAGFTASMALSAIVLAGMARLVLPLVAQAGRRAGTAIRLGLANLARPGLRPGAALIALGLAGTVIGFLLTYRSSWLAGIDPERRGGLPAFFAIDIQDDRLDAFVSDLTTAGATDVQVGQRVPARLRAINGNTGEDDRAGTREDERARFFRNREQNLSWRQAPGDDNRIVAGRWMDAAATTGPVEASLDQGWAQRQGIALGDRLRFDVAGTEIEAVVTSLRQVDWLTFRLNFFILLSPHALSGAPGSWIAAIGRLDGPTRERVQAMVARNHPGVTLIDVGDAAAKAVGLIDRMAVAIRLLALTALATALAVVAGLGLATASARRADAALLTVLGGRRRLLVAALAAEFAALGLAAGVVGVAAGAAAGAGLIGGLLGIAVAIPWWQLAGVVVVQTICAAVAGVLACRGALAAPPLAVLRE